MTNFMNKERTLKYSLVSKLILLGSILFISMIAILSFQYLIGIDKEMIIASKLDAKTMQRQFAAEPDAKSLILSTTHGYRTWSDIPTEIREAIDPNERTKIYIEDSFIKEGKALYFSIFTYSDNTGETFYLVDQYPTEELDSMVDEYITVLITYSFWVFSGFIALLLLFTFLWIRQLGLPFTQMQTWAEKLGKGSTEPRQSYKFKEFNQLAEQLEAAMQRVMAFNQREQQFLKHASHEFRTPIAIVQATLDTLQEQYQGDKRLMRIRHAMDNMQTTSTTLLWLARESKVREESDTVNIRQECETIVADLSYLNQNKAVSVSISGQGQITEQIALVRITLENLIRNAYQHCIDGTIHINVSAQRFSIKNPYEDNGSTQGFGLGLELVERISQKQNWILNIEKEKDEFTVMVDFMPS